MNICHINVGGLYSKLNFESIDRFCSKFDIICLTETKTSAYDFEDTLFENYDVILSISDKEENLFAAHGMCILVKKNLKQHVKIIENACSQFILWVTVDSDVIGYEFIIGAVYLPCVTSIHFDNDMFDDISDDISKFENPVCLIGDCNARTGDLDDLFDNQDHIVDLYGLSEIDSIPNFVRNLQAFNSFKRVNKDRVINDSGINLIELCKIHDLCIVNGRIGNDQSIGDFTCYTHNGASTIDYAIVSPALLSKTNDFCIHEYDNLFSDTHCPISISLSSVHVDSNITVNSNEANVEKPDHENVTDSKDISFKWNSGSPKDFSDSFNANDLDRLLNNMHVVESEPSQTNINNFCDELSTLLIEKAKECNICKDKPVVDKNKHMKNEKKNKPWFDRECRDARDEYYRVKSRLKFIDSNDCQSKVKLASKKFKNMIKTKKKSFLDNLHKKLRVMKSNNSKEYWAFLNKASSKQNTHNLSVEILKDHFQKISTVEDQHDNMFNLEIGNNSVNEDINILFTLEEIKHIIKKLKNGKACGIDHVRNEFLKNCPDEILSIFVNFFNIVLKTGIVPDVWCIGMILPLYKNKGDINDPDNYRGITLLSCLGKLFTAIINDRLASYIDATGIMGEEQAGFRYAYSTIDHIFTLRVIIDFYLKEKKKLFCAFIDYRTSKALTPNQ